MIRIGLGASDLAFLVGGLAALFFFGQSLPLHIWPPVFGWLSAIFARSSIEALHDAIEFERDRQDPVRCHRPVARGLVSTRSAVVWWVVLSCAAIVLACETNPLFAAVALPAWFIGSAHAAAPFKVRDFAFLDALGPALRLPLYLGLGWCALGATGVPPLALLSGAWMLGAFLIASAKIAEQRRSNGRVVRIAERSRFWLGIGSAMLYAFGTLASATFLVLSLRIEMLIAVPFVGALACYYLRIAMRKGEKALAPRRLLREPIFLALSVAIAVVVVNSLSTTIPALHDWFGSTGLLR